MQPLPFAVEKEIGGWTLFWARLQCAEECGEARRQLRAAVARRCRERLGIETLSGNATVAALRRLFKAAGCDPSRYRPSSEALLRRILKGEEIPAIHPLVDLNNCLSAELAVPCCVMTAGTFEPPLRFRHGMAGEAYESLKGPFELEGKPLLLDAVGPLDAPITGSRRVMVAADTIDAWLVAYLPVETLDAERAEQVLLGLLEEAPVARVLLTAQS